MAVVLTLAAGTANATTTPIPHRCTTKLAPRLCSIHAHHAAVNQLRHSAGFSRLPYRWQAERHPARRDRILRYWTRTHRRAELLAALYAIPAGVRLTLLCIHPYEEPSWRTSAGGLGFVYTPASYIGYVRSDYRGRVATLVGQFGGSSWYPWPMRAQLVVGAGLAAHYGYSPWTTAGNCT
jgi:hypothetical protein